MTGKDLECDGETEMRGEMDWHDPFMGKWDQSDDVIKRGCCTGGPSGCCYTHITSKDDEMQSEEEQPEDECKDVGEEWEDMGARITRTWEHGTCAEARARLGPATPGSDEPRSDDSESCSGGACCRDGTAWNDDAGGCVGTLDGCLAACRAKRGIWGYTCEAPAAGECPGDTDSEGGDEGGCQLCPGEGNELADPDKIALYSCHNERFKLGDDVEEKSGGGMWEAGDESTCTAEGGALTSTSCSDMAGMVAMISAGEVNEQGEDKCYDMQVKVGTICDCTGGDTDSEWSSTSGKASDGSGSGGKDGGKSGSGSGSDSESDSTSGY